MRQHTLIPTRHSWGSGTPHKRASTAAQLKDFKTNENGSSPETLRRRNLEGRKAKDESSTAKTIAPLYNKISKDLPILQEGDTVRLKPYKLGDRMAKSGRVDKTG